MNDPAQRAEFDERARERLRRQLLRYATEHGIGAPTLRDRIERADERGRELPLSTLQRFLNAKHRTLDLYVGMIAGFLAKENVSYDEAEFGRILSSFIGERAARPVDAAADNKWLQEFAGTYTHWTYGHGDVGTGELYYPPRGKARGSLTLSPVDGAPHLAAQRRDRIASPEAPSETFDPYEGVALASGGALYVFMRNCLTRAPQSGFMIPRTREDDLRTLEGSLYRLEPAGVEFPGAAPLTNTVRLQCIPAAEEAAADG